MKVRRIRPARLGIFVLTAIWMLVVLPLSVAAAPYAAYVIDARTGEVLHAKNAQTRLHPASLTKMMTLYIAFEAVRNGEISLDTQVRVSSHAASEPPSKLGLKSGQKIALRYLIRAAAVKSANDAATAIAEAISGSEAAFATRMTRTAKAMGMTQTTFKNAHGLTQSGHLSTARDMTILGRQLLYDFPQYYNLFSRKSTHAGIASVSNTNRRLLAAYQGADGIKTGYTRAAGFNLVASAKRGNERVIATVFGGQSTASRNARVAELLDLGFRRAPSRAPLRKPDRPQYVGDSGGGGGAGKTIRVSGAVQKSLRPVARPEPSAPLLVAEAVAEPDKDLLQASIEAAVAKAQPAVAAQADAEAPAEQPAEETGAGAIVTASAIAPTSAIRPAARPADLVLAVADDPVDRAPEPMLEPEREIVTRLSTSGGRHWGINVGRYGSHYQAEKVLLRTALSEMATLEGSLRKISQSSRGFDANFLGLSREQADLACRRLRARNVSCFMIGPS